MGTDEILHRLLSKVESMESKIAAAKSMNGEFDKLLLEVAHVKEIQAEILIGVRNVKKSVYEPDSGLFSRVKELELESARRLEYILETKPMIDEHKELALWKRQAEKDLAGLDELKASVVDLSSWKLGISKVIWFVALAAGGIWVKQVADILIHH